MRVKRHARLKKPCLGCMFAEDDGERGSEPFANAIRNRGEPQENALRFTLSQAAKEAGVSKSTVSKALSTGRMSGERLEDGSFQIEASELFRVFPKRADERGPEPFANPSEPQKTPSEPQAVALIRLRADMLEDQLRREREDRERERDTWNRERETLLERERTTTEDLRKRLDRAEERILALAAPAATEKPPERPSRPSTVVEASRGQKGLLGRLLGW